MVAIKGQVRLSSVLADFHSVVCELFNPQLYVQRDANMAFMLAELL